MLVLRAQVAFVILAAVLVPVMALAVPGAGDDMLKRVGVKCRNFKFTARELRQPVPPCGII